MKYVHANAYHNYAASGFERYTAKLPLVANDIIGGFHANFLIAHAAFFAQHRSDSLCEKAAIGRPLPLGSVRPHNQREVQAAFGAHPHAPPLPAAGALSARRHHRARRGSLSCKLPRVVVRGLRDIFRRNAKLHGPHHRERRPKQPLCHRQARVPAKARAAASPRNRAP